MDAPKQPDPVKTAQAQAQMNKETAIAQAGLNNVNQVTPYGNLTYKQIGTWPDGTPRYEATQSLSPENQALYDKYMGLAGQLGDIGGTLAGNTASSLSQPFKLGNEATEARLFELGSKRLDPMFAERDAQLEQQLMDRGIRPGSEAYDSMRRQFSEGRNDAYNQLLLQGRQLADQELTGERTQNLNELMALLGGSQVQNPSYVNTPQTPVAGTDYAGLVNSNYQNQVNQYNGMLGGIGGLAGNMLGAWAKTGFMLPSDARLKRDIMPTGLEVDGLPLYSFRYVGDDEDQVGFMAQDVAAAKPWAVDDEAGFLRVDYAQAVM